MLNSENSKLNVYAGTEVMISLLHSQGILQFKKIVEDTVFESLKILVDIATECKDKKCIIIISVVVNGSMRYFLNIQFAHIFMQHKTNGISLFYFYRFLVQPKVEATAESSKSLLFLELVSIMKAIIVPFLVVSTSLNEKMKFYSSIFLSIKESFINFE